MRKIRNIFCFYLIFILCIMQLFTVFVTANSIELIPIQDSYINNYSPNDNYGSFDDLRLTIPGPGQKIAYLRFNLSAIPSTAAIVSAELKLYLNQDISEAATVSAYYCYNNNWDELLINWTNAPSYQFPAIYSRNAIVFEGWYTWNVTTCLKTALSIGALTLILGENDGPSCYFFSKDIAYDTEKRPRLNITYRLTNVPPTANFSYSESNPTINDTIQFTDTSYDSDGYISSLLWNFNDGANSTISNPQYRFITTGTYVVSLEVTDNDGEKNLVSKTINVSQPNVSSNIPPTAFFSFYPFDPKINDTIQFIDYSNDTDGMIFLYNWDFGDGNTSELKNPTKKFEKPGTYSVSLKVTDNNAGNSTHTKFIVVAAYDVIDNNPPIPTIIVITLIIVLTSVLLLIGFLYLRERKKIRERVRERLRKEQETEQEKLK